MDAEIAEYLDHLAFDRERAPTTIARYRVLLRRFARFVGDGRSVRATPIDRKLVERFVRNGGDDAGSGAASTRNVRLAAVRGLFGYLVGEGKLDANPSAGLRPVKVKANSPGYLTESEFARLSATVRECGLAHYAARDQALAVVMFHSGLRITEALSLDLSQVDVEALLLRNVMRKGQVRDEVAINQTVVDVLRRWFLYRPGYKGATASQAVFLSDRGARLTARAFQRSFKRYVTLAGLGGRRLTPHSLRHSCATALYERGVGIEVIAKVLNHQKLETTLIYARVASRRKQEAVALLDRIGGFVPAGEKARNSGLTVPIPARKLTPQTSRNGVSANAVREAGRTDADEAYGERGS